MKNFMIRLLEDRAGIAQFSYVGILNIIIGFIKTILYILSFISFGCFSLISILMIPGAFFALYTLMEVLDGAALGETTYLVLSVVLLGLPSMFMFFYIMISTLADYMDFISLKK